MKATPLSLVALAAASLVGIGCAGTPAAPFNTLAQSQATALQLQNNQPIPAAAGAQPGTSMIPGLPPQLQTIISGATAAIPGLGSLPFPIPGLGGTAAAPAQQALPMFQGYPILKTNQLMDQSLREKLAKLFGDPDNFDNSGPPCMYPEMGLGWTGGAGGNNEMLISLTCRQVEARTFAWPHPGRSMKPNTMKQLADLMPQLLP